MASAAIEVSGPDAERLAAELRAVLLNAAEPGEVVAPVEVRRSAELVVAVIGLVLSGVSTAKTIWDWWQTRKPAGARVTILLDDGGAVVLSEVDRQGLEIALRQRTEPGSSTPGQ